MKTCVIILLFIHCVRTNVYSPNSLRLLERDSSAQQPFGGIISEGGKQPVKTNNDPKDKPKISNELTNKTISTQAVLNNTSGNVPLPAQLPSAKETDTTVAPSAQVPVSNGKTPVDTDKTPDNHLDFSDPGVIERALIVFGGFALLGVAYFIFYRKSSVKKDAMNPTDNNQFRYGVLNSEDQRDSMELTRVPLTMDSDDEDEEDLEIFDLTQKNKSLSYVNLQPSDNRNDVHTTNNESDTLLLDIDDRTDTLINWTNESKT